MSNIIQTERVILGIDMHTYLKSKHVIMINLKKRETIEGFGGKKRNDVLILKSQKKRKKIVC